MNTFKDEFAAPWCVAQIAYHLRNLKTEIMDSPYQNILDMQEHIGFSIEGLKGAFALLDNIDDYAKQHTCPDRDTQDESDKEVCDRAL